MTSLPARVAVLLAADEAAPRHRWQMEPLGRKDDGSRTYFPSIRVVPRNGDRDIDNLCGRIVINEGPLCNESLEDFDRLAEYVTAAVNDTPALLRDLLAALEASEAERERLRATVERLREALARRRAGRHDPDCGADGEIGCTCSYETLAAKEPTDAR